jgi:hypothetical protein
MLAFACLHNVHYEDDLLGYRYNLPAFFFMNLHSVHYSEDVL